VACFVSGGFVACFVSLGLSESESKREIYRRGSMLNNAKGGRGQRAPFRVHTWLAFERSRKKNAELFDGVAGGSSEGCTARGDKRPAKTSMAF